MDEKELQEKQDELTKRENELNERENQLNEREEIINAKEETKDDIVKQVKDEYEAKLLKQHDTYEAKITEQKKVIKQLLVGDDNANKSSQPTIVDKINARRQAQCKKW